MRRDARIAGLVLAAGAGTRMGGPKALLRVYGRRLVDRATDALRDGGCTRVVVVSGAVELSVPGATVVDNPGWAVGLSSSLRRGLTELEATDPDEVQAVCVLPVDVPGIGSAVVRRLLDAYVPGAVLVATYDGRRRNPVVVDRAHWRTVCELARGDEGARGFLSRHAHLVTPVECGDIGSPDDVDTAEELERWRQKGPLP